MSLDDYQRKRSFKKTPEPKGRPVRSRRRKAGPVFVVQLHHASHRHYDFRLEIDGVLKSWAVPKGPSLDPSVKRMAVEVEDHPLDYASFEGTIPHDQYGGGHVAVFDRGTWNVVEDGDASAQLAKGHIKFELHGQRLKGQWHLVRTRKSAGKPQWLLFKSEDAWAGPVEADDLLDGVTRPSAVDAARARRPGKSAPKAARDARNTRADKPVGTVTRTASRVPGAVKRKWDARPPRPMLTRSAQTPPTGANWLHEIKWDGYRILAQVRKGEVTLWSRNGLEWTRRMPGVRGAVAALELHDAVLDGEVIAGRGSREDFNRLQRALKSGKADALVYVAFDVLYHDGFDLRGASLVDRKALLKSLLDASPGHVGYSQEATSEAAHALRVAIDAGFEGIISKRSDSHYVEGRSDDWRKIKALESEEFAIVGYTPAKGSRTGIGALLLASRDAEHGWRYAGRVGSGFSNEVLRSLAAQFKGRGNSKPSVFVPPHDTDVSKALWFKPAGVVEVFVRGYGGNGLLRQASFKTLRPDKSVADLEAGKVDAAPPRAQGAGVESAAKKPARPVKAAGPADSSVVLSSPDKLLFPDAKITKQQVWEYYEKVMPWFLPEIARRPLSLVRCPSGIGRACFFQKHAADEMEHARDTAAATAHGLDADSLVVSDAEGVRLLVQYNALEFHPWGSRIESPDEADVLVFDLDPDEGLPWSEVVKAAREVRSNLQHAGLESFVRTSGGKGLHVVVPLRPAVPWSRAKPFAEAFAKTMASLDPSRFTAAAAKQQRKGRIFIDWLRNGRGATSVASFSLRARPGAPVAMPLTWTELGKIERGDAFNLETAPARMARWKAHPWGDYMALKQTLPT